MTIIQLEIERYERMIKVMKSNLTRKGQKKYEVVNLETIEKLETDLYKLHLKNPNG